MFEGARSKISRAKKHIRDLEIAFHAFVERNPYTFSVDNDTDGATLVKIRLTEPVPEDFGLIIGDVANNLCCSLDHATWELIGLDGGKRDRWTKMPTGSNRQDYEAACKGLKTPRSDTKQFFIDLAVHGMGVNRSIYELYQLNNADKHTAITPLVAAGNISSAQAVNWRGDVILSMKDVTLESDHNGMGRFMRLGEGVSFEFNNDTKVTPKILFRKWQGFGGTEVFPTLTTLANDTSVVVDAFEAFVLGRP